MDFSNLTVANVTSMHTNFHDFVTRFVVLSSIDLLLRKNSLKSSKYLLIKNQKEIRIEKIIIKLSMFVFIFYIE